MDTIPAPRARLSPTSAPIARRPSAEAYHKTVCHSQKEYVRGDAHTNSVEGFFSIFKRGVYGVYQHISEAHLKRYLAEFDFRYNHRVKRGFNDVARADKALEGIKGKRLTYQTTCRRRAEAQAQA